MRYHAVIFDCDGVLVDSETIHVNIELELLSELGASYERAPYIARFVGLGVPEFLNELTSDFQRFGLGDFPDDFMERLDRRAYDRIVRELRALPGAGAFARAVDGPIAVASSTPTPKLRHKLELTGLLDAFDPHVYSADQVERSKPAPDLFFFAAEKLSVQPDGCLVIEDSLNGVRAACAAGMTVIGYTGGGHADPGLGERLTDAGASAVFNSHDDIMAYIG